MNFDWNELAFGSKKPITSLKAIFIAAPRELSPARLNQLVKAYLPQGNIVVGIAKEEYILGFEDQPQFKTLRAKDVQALQQKVNAARLPYKLATLSYFQRDTKFILEKLGFKKVVFVNGSWRHLFHTQAPYYILATNNIPYELVSPFANEAEAKAYATRHSETDPAPSRQQKFTAAEMLHFADEAAKQSFDYGFQTGVALGRKTGGKYQLITTTFNKVVPYQTHAMHFGAARETNFSPMNDLNHYDTVHAEVELVIKAQKEKLDLHDTTLFINLLPCPTCARMFSQTDIAEFVYREDHSAGYAIDMLQKVGKKVTRIVG